jgi:hypothetical protein
MTLTDIAEALVDGCRTGQEAANLDTLYDAGAVSVEAADYTGAGRATRGVEGIKGKHAWWETAFELHSADLEGRSCMAMTDLP